MKRSGEHKRFKSQTGRGERESGRHKNSSVQEPQARAQKSQGVTGAQLYGVAPVLEALRAGQRPIERVTIAEGAQHHRLRELVELARKMNVPVHHAPRIDLARAVGAEANHQGVVATV